MNTLHWIVGGALAMGVAVPVAASPRATADVQDVGVQAGVSSNVSRNVDNGTSGGTLLRSPRQETLPASASSDAGSDPAGASPGGTGERPAPMRHSSVGWQSLLPGSIQ